MQLNINNKLDKAYPVCYEGYSIIIKEINMLKYILIISLTISVLGCKIQVQCTPDYCIAEGETLEQIGVS